MTSYQVMCSVIRPLDPVSVCAVAQLEDKAQRHVEAVLQNVPLLSDSSNGPSANDSRGPNAGAAMLNEDSLLCAVVSKTSALFSGANNFQSRVKLRYFWCNLCSFDTESKAGLLQHVVSQHCFRCRFCPFMALSRTHVIQHALGQHSQFLQQFQEQRLKTCQLRRDMFQRHFSPQSDPGLPRKRGMPADSDAEGRTDEEPTPAKQSREEPSTEDREMKTEEEEEEGEQSSSNESVDELPLHFTAEEHTSSLKQTGVAGLATRVMENIVSSSGIEPDVAVERVSTAGGESSTTNQGPVAMQEKLSRTEMLKEKEGSAARVKQESQSANSVLASALARFQPPASVEEKGGEGDDSVGPSASGAAAISGIVVKQETEDTPSELCHLAVPSLTFAENLSGPGLQSSVESSTSSRSPPLSNIHVETLQRQFEESFGAHLSSMAAPFVLDAGDVQPQSSLSLLSTQKKQHLSEIVENFLMDSTPSSHPESQSSMGVGQGPTASSMLRHLLTRPRQQDPESQERPLMSGSGRGDPNTELPEVQGHQACQSDKETLSNQKKGFSMSVRKQHTENFLLTPGIESQFQINRLEPSVRTADDHRADTPSPGNFPAVIKLEPEDNDDYSSAFVAAPFSSSDHEKAPEGMSLQGMDEHFAGADKLSGQKPQASNANPSSDMLGKKQMAPPSPGKSTSTPTIALSPAEKLKSYSNMSLRDLLTMRTEVNQQGGAVQTPSHAGSSRDGYHVVWECGFCHFDDHRKSVVLAHRRLCHGQLSEETGHREEDAEHWAGRSADWEDQDGERELDKEEVAALKQPSTSGGKGSKVLQQMSSPPWSGRQGPVSHSTARTSRLRGFQRKDDFEYLSEDSVEITSGSEPEDLEDKNYVPPKNLSFQQMDSSEDEEEEEELSGEGPKLKKGLVGSKKRKGWAAGGRHHSKRGQEEEEQSEETTQGREGLFQCPYCDHHPASEQVLKDHIRHTECSSHLLIIHKRGLPESLRHICSGDNCADLGSFDAHYCRSYLVHVLQCQGHILDAHRPSVHSASLTSLDKAGRVAGFLNCPINSCYFVSYFREQMRVHLESHIQHLHHSQMLLFRSVCTAMAKFYGSVGGFDRYICYRCSSIVVDLGQVVKHMKAEHGGQVRGVLHVTQRLEGKSRGILVAVQCLQCLQRVPSLDQWFGHQCQPLETSSDSEARASPVGSNMGPMSYKPSPCVPSFDEWLWKMSNVSVKEPAPRNPADKSEAETGTQHQLPLIRSILLQPTAVADSQKQSSVGSTPQSDRASKSGTVQKKMCDTDKDDESTSPLIECEHCQEFVPETSWKWHKCFVKEQRSVSGKSQEAGKMTKANTLSSSSAASSSGDSTPVSHSKLLAALATRHQADPPSSHTAATAVLPLTLRPTGHTSTHPSLVSLLTRTPVQAKPAQPSSQEEVQPSRESHPPPRKDGGMIRTLLSHSVLGSKLRSDVPKGNAQIGSPSPTQRAVSDDAASQAEREPSVQWPGSAASILQNLAGERSGVHRASSSGSSSASGVHKTSSSGSSSASAVHRAASSGSSSGSGVHRTSSSGSPSASTTSSSAQSQPPLMNFLRQQGDQVMQVLGNVLDDQGSSSSS